MTSLLSYPMQLRKFIITDYESYNLGSMAYPGYPAPWRNIFFSPTNNNCRVV